VRGLQLGLVFSQWPLKLERNTGVHMKMHIMKFLFTSGV